MFPPTLNSLGVVERSVGRRSRGRDWASVCGLRWGRGGIATSRKALPLQAREPGLTPGFSKHSAPSQPMCAFQNNTPPAEVSESSTLGS